MEKYFKAIAGEQIMDYRDLFERAAKTFVQAFLAAWALSGNQVSKTALVAAAAAGISAGWNFIKGTM